MCTFAHKCATCVLCVCVCVCVRAWFCISYMYTNAETLTSHVHPALTGTGGHKCGSRGPSQRGTGWWHPPPTQNTATSGEPGCFACRRCPGVHWETELNCPQCLIYGHSCSLWSPMVVFTGGSVCLRYCSWGVHICPQEHMGTGD